jgi:hypothetical protein
MQGRRDTGRGLDGEADLCRWTPSVPMVVEVPESGNRSPGNGLARALTRARGTRTTRTAHGSTAGIIPGCNHAHGRSSSGAPRTLTEEP